MGGDVPDVSHLIGACLIGVQNITAETGNRHEGGHRAEGDQGVDARQTPFLTQSILGTDQGADDTLLQQTGDQLQDTLGRGLEDEVGVTRGAQGGGGEGRGGDAVTLGEHEAQGIGQNHGVRGQTAHGDPGAPLADGFKDGQRGDLVDLAVASDDGGGIVLLLVGDDELTQTGTLLAVLRLGNGGQTLQLTGRGDQRAADLLGGGQCDAVMLHDAVAAEHLQQSLLLTVAENGLALQ